VIPELGEGKGRRLPLAFRCPRVAVPEYTDAGRFVDRFSSIPKGEFGMSLRTRLNRSSLIGTGAGTDLVALNRFGSDFFVRDTGVVRSFPVADVSSVSIQTSWGNDVILIEHTRALVL
jgi:hypothetical protein